MTASPETYRHRWETIDGLPVAVITGGVGDVHAYHPLAAWRMKTNVYFDGSVRPFSGEFGSRFFTSAPFHADARCVSITVAGVTTALDLNNIPGVVRRLGMGWFSAEIPLSGGVLHQDVVVGSLDAREILVRYRWQGDSTAAPRLFFPVNAAGVHSAGTVINIDIPYYGRVSWTAAGLNLATSADGFGADLRTPFILRIAYDPAAGQFAVFGSAEVDSARAAIAAEWRQRCARLRHQLTGEAKRELEWVLSQMVGTVVRDGTRNRYCCTNGALYSFNHLSTDLDQRRGMGSFRDGNQVAFALAATFPELSRDQTLRTVEAFNAKHGIPQASCAHPLESYLHRAPGGETGGIPADLAVSSDQVWWWVLTLTEYIRVTGDRAILSEQVSNADGVRASVRDHLDGMLRFADVIVGYGPHGLPRFLAGDWSDYLGRIGLAGRGESFFNAALAIIALERLASLFDQADAARLRDWATRLRAAVAPFITATLPWYPRAVDDGGALVGNERIFLEVQPWLAMAGIGSADQRRAILRTVAQRCATIIGPALIDRPLDLPDFAGRTHCTYPPGTGENGGVWWIAGYWLTMALDQEGLHDEAAAVYASCSLANHHQHFPQEWWSPFTAPDGIDGPASPHFGKAQQPTSAYPQPWANSFCREINPHEVAKFAYQIHAACHRTASAP